MPGFRPSITPGEYLINFDTESNPGKIGAVRIRLDFVEIQPEDMNTPFSIDLVNDPMFPELKRYLNINGEIE